MPKLLFPILLFCFTLVAGKTLACATDVTILEGASIEMCADGVVDLHAASGFVSYTWSGAGTGNSEVLTPTISGVYTVDAVDGVGCISSASISVTIHPTPNPTVFSSEGNTLCPESSGTVLSLSEPFVAYSWSNGSNDPAILVNSPGTYSVDVIDTEGCGVSVAITITQTSFDLNVSNSVACSNTTVLFEASGADIYSWSTGEFGSSIVIAAEHDTTISVTLTKGSCVQTLSESVTVVEVEDYEMPDTVYTASGQPVYISGPAGFDDYSWFPTENISTPTNQGVTFSGDTTTTLTLIAQTDAGCSIQEDVVVIVVRLSIPEGFSPNSDLKNDFFIIPELFEYPGDIVIWNRWGDIVFRSPKYLNNWDGTCQEAQCLGSSDLPEGTYFYRVLVDEIKVDGFVTLKR